MAGNQTIYIIIALLVLVWIFKEVRTRYLKDLDFEISRIDQILKVYGELEIKIIKCLENESDKEKHISLLETISLSYSYLSRKLYHKCKDYLEDMSKNNLEQLLRILRKEIDSMNYEQNNRIDIEKKEMITYFANILKPFFIPVAITFMTLLLVIIASLFGLSMSNPALEWHMKLWVASTFGSGFLFLLFAYVFVSILTNKKFKNKWVNWIYILVTLMLFILIFYIDYLSIFCFVFLIYFLFFRFPKMMKRE
ncbi:hypothetical protein [Paenibacillus solani]|uniref:Uncharacterized protein n=1 Tax=Paenibacillus solani TaxID=1705565 RepID=A0A0M1P7C6_9BACL|nr:hypothetical protein [Paenibacillus solani]KOR90366.1 hypothetical protein AM231_15370 [Paenibacillus solani]